MTPLVRPGYQAGAQFLKPDFLARDQQLELDLNAVKQNLQAYDQTALLEKIALNRKLSHALDRQPWSVRRAGVDPAGG